MGLTLLGEGCHRLASPTVDDGGPNSESYAWSTGGDHEVSKAGVELVLNAVHESTDSSKEFLKQAMLHHEVVFRNQVLELHRLYWTQKNLMNDLSWKYFDKTAVSTDYQTSKQGTEIESMDYSPGMVPALAQNGIISQECAVPGQGIFNLQFPFEGHMKNADTKCLEIQTSVCCEVYDDSDSDELHLTLGNKNRGNNNRKDDGKILYDKDSRLSTKDVVNMETSAAFISHDDMGVIASFDCQSHATDGACMPSVHLPATYVTFTGRTRKEVICRPFVYHPNADHSKTMRENSSLDLDFGWHEFRGRFSTYRVNHEPQPTSNNPRSFDLNVTQFESFPEISQKKVNLHSSESSSTIPSGTFGVPGANTVATPASLREFSIKSSEDTSDVLQTSDRNSASMRSQANEVDFLHPYSGQASLGKTQLAGYPGNSNQEENNLSTLRSDSEYIADCHGNSKEVTYGSFDGNGLVSAYESPSRFPSGLYQLSDEVTDKSLGLPGCYIKNERKNMKTVSIIDEKVHPSTESSNTSQKDSARSELEQSNSDKQLDCEKIEDGTVSSRQCRNLMSVDGAISVSLEELQDEHDGADLIREKFEHIERNKTYSRNNAELGGHNTPTTNDNIQANETSLMVAEKSTGKQEVITEPDYHVTIVEKPCSSSESTDESLEKKEAHAPEMNTYIWRAAESLIHISLQNTGTSDEVANIGQMQMENEERNDQPENSSDSFESMVLMLTETSNDAYSMPLRLPEEETGKGKCMFKLRKRRGVCDFQRDVLPGLVSLSRHEICEDLHTIGEAVSSHEVTHGTKKLSRGNWFTPARSRRSRLSYVGKRQ